MKRFIFASLVALSILTARPSLGELTQLTEPQTALTAEKPVFSNSRLGAEPQLGPLVSRAFIALGFLSVVTLLAFGLRAKLGQGLGKPKTEDKIKVLCKKALGPKHALLIVDVAGEQLLLAQTTEQVTLLTKLDDVGSLDSRSFAAFLKHADLKDGSSNMQIGGV